MSLNVFVFVIQISVVIILNKVSSDNLADVQSKDNKVARVTTIINQTSNATSRIASAKRWQVGRVTQKRYEIINVLWRKTKIFDDIEIAHTQSSTKESIRNRKFHSPLPHNFMNRLPYLKKSSSTPSYIEFNYSDLNDDRVKRKNSDNLQSFDTNKNTNIKNKDLQSILNSPFFVFHVQYETCKPKQSTDYTSQTLSKKNGFKNILISNQKNKILRKLVDAREDDSYLINNGDAETCPATTSSLETINTTSAYIANNTHFLTEVSTSKSTTIYDKIKFFEIYDSDTPIPRNEMTIASNTNSIPRIDYSERILLNNINFDMRNHNNNKTKFVKKHVDNIISSKISEKNEHLYYSDKVSTSRIPTKTFILTKQSYKNQPAAWSDFPFVAVYVHEPSQVRCDAAAISPHWLLAAGSCLSRHYKNTYSVDGQSAYVVYCTDNWRNSERITYVKRSFIHPRFDLRDGVKRYLYNIGVIQIVNSMAETCNGWAPVSLMSHQMYNPDIGLAGQPQGVEGVSVGWGLDRYDASYNFEIQNPLMIYKGLVHSQTCPGLIGNRNGKIHRRYNNVYCLSLPSYSSEINDPGHGAMLLIGGKLIALYLQEEHRPSGERSALYTEVWHHIPWLRDTAKETDEYFTFL